MRKFSILHVILLFAGLTNRAAAQEKQPLRLVQTISIPGIQGRIDHVDADVEGQRLFVAGLENGSLEVVDLAAGKWIRSIHGFKKPQGVWYVRELNKLFVASGDDGMVRVFRGDSLELIDSVKLEIGPNRIIYDPPTGYLYVGYGGQDAGFEYGRVGIIDARSDKYLGGDMITFGHPAHPAEILLDQAGQRILVSDSRADRIYVFNTRNCQLVMTWPARGKDPGDMAFDQVHHRLFVGTRTPPEMTVYDSSSGQEVASLPTGEGMDGVYYDPRHKRVYVSGGRGFDVGHVYVYQQKDADRYELVGTVPTRPGAGTSLWIPSLNRYVVPAPAHDQRDAAILVFEPEP
jgi:DNA-binding beta-propeller fold protein YncE